MSIFDKIKKSFNTSSENDKKTERVLIKSNNSKISNNNKNTYKQSVLDSKGTKEGLSYKENELNFNHIKINSKHIKILKNCNLENSAKELRNILKMTNVTKFKNNYLNPLINLGFFETTIAKQTSPSQKYRFTKKFVNRLSKN